MAYIRIKCSKCDETFGQESRFLDHLTSVHLVEDHLQHYLDVNFGGVHPTCSCREECQEKLSWSGWKKGFTSKYVRGHNAKVDSVYHDTHKQIEFARKRSEGYKQEKYSVWNSGLTKQSSQKVSETSKKISASLKEGYDTGKIKDWRLLDSEKASQAAKKVSETKKKKYATGELVPWNLGLTKDVSESLLKSSNSIKENYQNNPEASSKRLTPEEVVSRIEETNKFDLLSDPSTYRNKYQKLRLRCKECQSIQLKNMMMIDSTPTCHVCHPKESKGQLEILEFVKSLTPHVVSSDRTIISPLEIDVLIPDKKLAIEYNGLYWHSSARILDKDYHERKRELITRSEHRFLGIYEDEWRDKKLIVQGMIKHRLGICDEIYDARKLSVEQLDQKTSMNFFESTHLEGSTKSKVTFGLVDQGGNVLAAMSLRKPFHTTRSSYLEVARSATLPNISIRGWLGKLTKTALIYSRQDFSGLMTYVDSRVGMGFGYESSNMWKLKSSNTGPRFWWTDFRNRYNRFKFKADKKNNLTQAEVASQNGVVEIWGCSNSLFFAQ